MVLTGGQDIYKGSIPTTKVTVYNENGLLADWPHLETSRYNHGCGHFINADNKVVSKKIHFSRQKYYQTIYSLTHLQSYLMQFNHSNTM